MGEEHRLVKRKKASVSLEEKLLSLVDPSAWSKICIFRLPARVTAANETVYKPHIVSIGPYHHGKASLKAMEEHKYRAVSQFLKRTHKGVGDLFEVLAPVAQDLKDAYDQLDDPKWEDTDTFLQVMVVDGCFILELLRTRTDYSSQTHGYPSTDPVFGSHSSDNVCPYLLSDVLILENQIPLLALQKLHSMQNEDSREEELIVRILEFLPLGFERFQDTSLAEFCRSFHILDVYRKSLLGFPPADSSVRLSCSIPMLCRCSSTMECCPCRGEDTTYDDIIPTATGLREAGILIGKSTTRSLRDITFHGGVLKLPVITVDDSFESLFRNAMAYEQFHVGTGKKVSDYIFFLDSLINGNAKDARLLRSVGVIQNLLGNDKAAAQLINSLGKDTTLDDPSLWQVYRRIGVYCMKFWPRSRAYFMHNHTDKLSLLSAILLALTAVQTVYAVLSYGKQGP